MLKNRKSVCLVAFFLVCLFVTAPVSAGVGFDNRTIDTIPLHVFGYYDSGYLSYTFTTSEKERQDLIKAGLRYEGIVAHLSSQPLPGTFGLYRMQLGHDRYLAVGEASRDEVIAKYGYADKGLIGHVYPRDAIAEAETNVHVWYKPNQKDMGSKFGTANDWHAYHYYLGAPAKLNDRKYEGIAFRAWSKSQTLQRIKIISPNEGGTLMPGQKVTIRWQSTPNRGIVDLRYAVKEGKGWSSWHQIVSNLSSSGSFEWTIPGEAAGEISIGARWNAQSAEGKQGWAFDEIDKNLIINNTIIPFKKPILKQKQASETSAHAPAGNAGKGPDISPHTQIRKPGDHDKLDPQPEPPMKK